jgi:hypothetical protein
MTYIIAQLSDTHVGGPATGSGDRLSVAIDTIGSMSNAPDLVLVTGDLTHNGTADEWAEFRRRMAPLTVPWVVIPGNHDRGLAELAGHRVQQAGPLRLVLLDSSSDLFSDTDATWLDETLAADPATPTVIAIHHPPFETGIWWMDCVGLKGADRFEAVVRRHDQVLKVLSGHVHRLIQTSWGSCSLWVCPSTAVALAVDLDPAHAPAETAEGPAFSLHAFTGRGIVSHVVAVGPQGDRNLIEEQVPDFVTWVRGVQAERVSLFS